MRDTENDVAIDVLLSGEFPGDGLDRSVRARFEELWIAAQGQDPTT